MARNPGRDVVRNQPARRGQPAEPPAQKSWLHQCVTWPVYEVLLSKEWDVESAIITSVVARKSPRSGKIAAASYMVDLGCMGVKKTFVRICKSPEDYERRMRTPLMEDHPMVPADFNLVAKIIAYGHAYAQQLGIAPDPEFQQARLLLSGAQIDACPRKIPLGGPEGKPIFVARPNDDIERIMNQLARVVGPDGFYYMLPGATEKQVFNARLPGIRTEPARPEATE